MKTSAATVLFFTCLAGSVTAAEIHKWVDSDGITHYSDEPPPTVEAKITRIDVDKRRDSQQKSNYYSIANQWARMHRERIERERIRLEQERIKAARQAQTPRTEVVYVEKPAVETRYVSLHKPKWHRRHGHHRGTYRYGKPGIYAGQNRFSVQNSRANPGYFKPLR